MRANMAGPKMRWELSVCALLSVLVVGCGRCSGRTAEPSTANSHAPARRPNVLLVTLDTTRADRLGCYGYARARTPRLDALAHEGVLVEHAVASAPITAPSHSSMLTGLYPATHSVRDNGSFRLPDAVETLPEILKANGYATSAFVSAAVLHHRYNLSQGFDVYDDDLWSEDAPELFMIRERRGSRTVAQAKTWLDTWHGAADRKPFFAWVHLFDVHQPHEALVADMVLTASPYDAEIAGVDRYVGDLLDKLAALSELDNTIVIVTADHGESLGEHGEATHAVFVYESTIHVPLLVRFPRELHAGTRYSGPMRHIDLLPTLLSALNISHRGFVQGVSLWDALRGEAPAPDFPQVSESLVSELGFGMAPLFAIRRGSLTYVRAPRIELYNRHNDPREAQNLASTMPDQARELDQALSGVMHECSSHAFTSDRSAIDQETEESLRALGYVGDPGTANAMNGLDPKDGLRLYQMMHRARAFVRARRFDDAVGLIHEVLEQTPANLTALNLEAMILLERRIFPAARAAYARSLAVDPRQERVLLQLSGIDLAEGKLDEATAHINAALEISPSFVEAVIAKGLLALRRHDANVAEAELQRAIALDPSYPRAVHAFADFEFRQANFAEAERYYARTLELAPRSFDALNQMGATLRRLGRTDAALEYYNRAAAVRPDSWVPNYNRGCALALAGRGDDAMRELSRAADLHMPHPDLLERDDDLTSLRERPDFAALLARARRSARPAAPATLDE